MIRCRATPSISSSSNRGRKGGLAPRAHGSLSRMAPLVSLCPNSADGVARVVSHARTHYNSWL